MSDSPTPKQRSVAGAKIFVSYSRDDKEFAHQLNFMLRDMGFEPLMDVRAIHPGEPWEERLTNLIEQCDKVVFVMTPDYLASEPCSWEVGMADKLGKEMIPVLPGPLPEGTAVPDELARLQYVYFYTDTEAPDSGFYTGTRKLEEAIRTDLDWLGQLRRYQSRAADWQDSADEDQLLKGGLLAEALTWQKLTPEESEVPDLVTQFIEASAASEQKFIAAQKRRMRITTLAAVAAIGFAGVAGFFGLEARQSERNASIALDQAEQSLADLGVALDDSDLLASASQKWAEGSRQFGEIKSGQFISSDGSEDLNALELSALSFASAVNELFPLPADDPDYQQRGLSAEGKNAYRAITAAMRRDYAEALYYKSDANAAAQLDLVIEDMRAELSSDKDLNLEDLQRTLSNDYLKRAIYSCNSEARLSGIGRDLMQGNDLFAQQNPQWAQIIQLTRSGNEGEICNAAQVALCELADCNAAPRPPTRSLDPLSEADGEFGEPNPGAPGATAETRTPDAFQIRSVFLHIGDASQRPAAKAFAAQLSAQGYDVLGIEVVGVSYTPSIRYYYDVQRDLVEAEFKPAFRRAAEEALSRAGGDPSLARSLQEWAREYKLISLDGRYKGLARDRIEVWL